MMTLFEIVAAGLLASLLSYLHFVFSDGKRGFLARPGVRLAAGVLVLALSALPLMLDVGSPHGIPLRPYVMMVGIGVVLGILAVSGKRLGAEENPGYRAIVSGFWLFLLNAVIGISASKGLMGLVGPSVAILCETVINGLGIVLLAYGFMKWLPAVAKVAEVGRELQCQKEMLEETVARRTADLRKEIAVREEAERRALAASEAKSTFLANMSHELRTPLNAVIGFSDLLAGPMAKTIEVEKQRSYAADINISGRHLLEIINDVLDLAKIEAGKMAVVEEPVNLSLEIDRAVSIVSGRMQAMQVSVVKKTDEKVVAMGDGRAIRQILINLLSNAVKFSQAGGAVNVTMATHDGRVEIQVADRGCGIPKDKLEKVFEPFEQIDNAYARAAGGTGLGLAICRSLAGLMGGEVLLESDLGKGTVATLALPSHI